MANRILCGRANCGMGVPVLSYLDYHFLWRDFASEVVVAEK